MKLNNEFVSYEIDGEKILVCLDSRKFSGVIKLNSTAAFITELLKENTSKESIVAALMDHYEAVTHEQATQAVNSVIESLTDTGAIEP